MKPDKRPANPEFFYVCATKLQNNGKPSFADIGGIAYYQLKEIQQNPTHFSLCRETISHNFNAVNNYHAMQFYQTKDEFYLKVYTDGLGDPLEFWYKIKQNHIEPLASRRGTQMMLAMASWLGLLFAIFPYKISVWGYRSLKKLKGTNNESKTNR